jgi:hypothetical protein
MEFFQKLGYYEEEERGGESLGSERKKERTRRFGEKMTGFIFLSSPRTSAKKDNLEVASLKKPN